LGLIWARPARAALPTEGMAKAESSNITLVTCPHLRFANDNYIRSNSVVWGRGFEPTRCKDKWKNRLISTDAWRYR